MSGALPDWTCALGRAGSILHPIPFSVLLMTHVLALKALFSYLFMMASLVGLQLFLRLEKENFPQQVVWCPFPLPPPTPPPYFFPFWIASCWQMLCLDRNNQAIIPQNIEFRVNYKLSLHHQYYVIEGVENIIFSCINKTIYIKVLSSLSADVIPLHILAMQACF